MRWLTIAVAVLAVLWGGYWWVGSTGLERGLLRAVEGGRDAGWRIEYADLSVSGFPNRFDTSAADLTVSPPDGSWVWQAPYVQAYALSYRPNRVIVAFPSEQVVDGPLGRVDVTAADMRLSAAVRAEGDLPLDRATWVAEGLGLAFPWGTIGAEGAQVAIREAGAPGAYDVAVTVSDAVIPSEASEGSGPDLPGTVEAATLDATVTLDRALDRTLGAQPNLVALDLRDATLVWGAVEVTAQAALAVGTDGLADGEVVVEIADVDAVLPLLERGVPAGQRAFVEGLLRAAPVDGRAGSGSVRLAIQENLVLFGPFPVASLPRFGTR
ncbi:DUF2125 domain-containing protein [Jannaschia sp. LMIT008]|uniref:DUF2125 domain-containing protein n=1 Tax=Jannaschia maritima TaxID=3032585 RepID=UPI0028128122|nr:DUF2125 domain-containing protein [Jannaschia sp. LMIT008]